MTKGPFERALVRKGKSALKVARLALNAGDNDNWLQLRERIVSDAKAAGHSKDAERSVKEDQGHSIDDDLDE